MKKAGVILVISIFAAIVINLLSALIYTSSISFDDI